MKKDELNLNNENYKTVTIHQPDHLPWLGFMNKVDQADLFVILDCVQFSKGVFQHRNRIIGTNNEPTWLTIPLSTKNHQELTLKDMRINNNIDWQCRYKNIIYERYHNHPKWLEHKLYIETLWTRSFDNLFDLNMDIINYLLQAFGISTPIILASSLNPTGKKSELNLDICKKVGADTYLAGPLSKNYLDESIFHKEKITVQYHEFNHPTYKQFKRTSFISHLSSLDLLMNYGERSLEIIRGRKI